MNLMICLSTENVEKTFGSGFETLETDFSRPWVMGTGLKHLT
jgi:hypothetical protein